MNIIIFLFTVTVASVFWHSVNRKFEFVKLIEGKIQNRIGYNIMVSIGIVAFFYQFLNLKNRYVIIPIMMSTVNAFLIKNHNIKEKNH